MSIELQTALISAGVAVVTAFLGGYISWSQLRRERNRWLIDLKSNYSLELYRSRLESYPKASVATAKLSSRSESVAAETAKEIVDDLNTWLTLWVVCVLMNAHAERLSASGSGRFGEAQCHWTYTSGVM